MSEPTRIPERLALAALFAYLAVDLTRLHLAVPWFGRLRPMLLLGLVVVATALWSRLRELPTLVRPLFPAGVLVAWVAGSVIWSVDRGSSLGKSIEVVKIAAIVAVTVLLIDNSRRFLAALALFALSMLAVAVETIVSSFRSGLLSSFSYGKLAAGVRDNNDVARLLVMALPIWWALWVQGGRWQRRLAGVGLAATLLGVVATYSRGGLLTTLGVLCLLGVVARRGQRLVVVLAASLLAAALLAPTPYKERVGSLPSLMTEVVEALAGVQAPKAVAWESRSGEDRLAIWEVGTRMIAQRLIVGNGVATFESRYAELEPERTPRSSHNIYVELWAELGVVGLLAYLWMWGAALLPLVRGWWNSRRVQPVLPQSAAPIALAVSAVAFLASSGILSNPFRSEAFTILALCLVARRIEHRPYSSAGG